jgi:hypothetical protein
MTYCKDFDYGGYNIWCGETTEWMYGKTEIIEKYPELGRIPILQTKQDYCGGGAYFLSKKSVDIIINNPQFFIPFPKNAYTNYIKVIDGKEHFCNLYLFEDYTIGLVLRRYNKIAVLCIPKDLLSTCVTW